MGLVAATIANHGGAMKKAALALALLGFVAADPAQPQSRPPLRDKAEQPCGALPKPFDGVAFAVDGNTLAIVGKKPNVRIWGIQAPELRDKDKRETVPGMRARAALEDLLAPAGHKVHCNPTHWDHSCRIVASCVAKTTEIGGRMIDDGMAYGFQLDDATEADVPLSLSYAESEAAARKEKRGLWPMWLAEPMPR